MENISKSSRLSRLFKRRGRTHPLYEYTEVRTAPPGPLYINPATKQVVADVRTKRRLERIYRDRAPQFAKQRTHAVERNAISKEDAFMLTVVLALLTAAFVLLFGA